MTRPPTGTVTFLFTDVEGSTRMWDRDAAAMQSALARHDEILKEAIETDGGLVFKTVGDAFCAAFSNVSDALEAAISAQRALLVEEWDEGSLIRVRMALHAGAAEERGSDYFGSTLNRVSRLLSAGHGGQTLVSHAARELTGDRLPPGTSLQDLGEHRLKDLTRPERVFQLLAPDLPASFPALRTLDARRNNLSVQPNALVGREREVEEVCERVKEPGIRLLTLTGPGGTGKTRLGLQAAADLLEDFEDGVFFVALADVNDTALVPATIARALGAVESPELPLEDLLKEYLSRKGLLLVLDNFEQVLEAAPLVGSLLAAAPRLKVLATSRAVLRVYGEQEYPVPPLALPDPARLPPAEMLERYEAVRLFAERARAVKPGFVLDGHAPAVAEICARLDGLPLAIELAAARTRLLPPKAMLKRLGDRLKLLTGGARDLPGRQQTLRGAIDWSHDLLGEEDRRLFRRMSVFSGGRTLDAMEAICGAEEDLDVYAGIESLLEKSLIRQEEGPEDEPRFVMLETIHEYAREKLQQSGESEETKRLHAEYFLSLAEEAEPEIDGPDQVSWMDRLEAEHDNLRAALSWSLETGDAESALRIGGALWRFWGRRGYSSEGRRWLSAGLSTGETAPVGVRARALLAAGELAMKQGDYTRADEDLEASLALYREAGDRRGEAHSLSMLGWIATDRDELDRAGELLEEGLALSREAGSARDVSNALNGLAGLNLFRGDYARAATLLEEGLSLAREAGDVRGTGVLTLNLGLTAAMAGEYERAEAFAQEAQGMFREHGDVSGGAEADLLRGFLALVRNDLDRAERLCVGAMRVSQEIFQAPEVLLALDILGGVAAARGEVRKAVRLWGATAGYREATGYPWLPEERTMIEPYIDAARIRLEEAVWREEWEKGRSMTLDQAVDYALEGSGDRAMEQG